MNRQPIQLAGNTRIQKKEMGKPLFIEKVSTFEPVTTTSNSVVKRNSSVKMMASLSNNQIFSEIPTKISNYNDNRIIYRPSNPRCTSMIPTGIPNKYNSIQYKDNIQRDSQFRDTLTESITLDEHTGNQKRYSGISSEYQEPVSNRSGISQFSNNQCLTPDLSFSEISKVDSVRNKSNNPLKAIPIKYNENSYISINPQEVNNFNSLYNINTELSGSRNSSLKGRSNSNFGEEYSKYNKELRRKSIMNFDQDDDCELKVVKVRTSNLQSSSKNSSGKNILYVRDSGNEIVNFENYSINTTSTLNTGKSDLRTSKSNYDLHEQRKSIANNESVIDIRKQNTIQEVNESDHKMRKVYVKTTLFPRNNSQKNLKTLEKNNSQLNISGIGSVINNSINRDQSNYQETESNKYKINIINPNEQIEREFKNNIDKNKEIKIKKETSHYVNIEDLMLIEEKLSNLIQAVRISQHKSISNFAIEWWNYSTYCCIGEKFEQYFKDLTSKMIVKESCIIELISVLLGYDISFNKKIFEILNETIINCLLNIHQNFMIICDYILSKVSAESRSNIWVEKLNNLLQKKMMIRSKKGENIIGIKSNNEETKKLIRLIFKVYKTSEFSKNISLYINQVNKLTLSKVNELFKMKSLRVDNINASVHASSITEPINKVSDYPFVKTKSLKEFTLVLDLDETLIHFSLTSGHENKGILSLRPGLFDFLEKVSKFYELMIFTASTNEYADPIIDAIESKKKYFAYRFYRQHTLIINQEFIKDLTLIGRDISRIIIVDNIANNFSKNKENGILIKPFYGIEAQDKVLTDLAHILLKMAIMKTKDLRECLVAHKDDILRKITFNYQQK